MKKRLLLLLITAFTVCWQVSAQGPVNCYGKLKVNTTNGQLYGDKTGSNNTVQVKGVSFGWNMFPESQGYFTSSVVDAMVDGWKAEVVRAPMGTRGNQWDIGWMNANSSQRTTLKKRITDVVDRAIDKGVYVIIDWHSHAAEIDETSEAVAFFSDMAKTYGNKDNVIFEIYNEPLGADAGNDPYTGKKTNTTWSGIRTYSNTVIAEIRKYSDNLILVGTRNYSQCLTEAADNPVTDSKNNVAYVLHFYAANMPLSTPTPTNGWSRTLQGQIEYAISKKCAVFVSEWGTVNSDGAGGHNGPNSDAWMTFLNNNKISSCAWQLSHKSEASAFFKSNLVGQATSAFTNTNNLSASGQYIYNMLTTWANSAPWRKNCADCPVKYSITFNTNGGDPLATQDGICAGQTISTEPTPKKSGNRFEGWFSALTGGTKYTFPLTVNGNMTLYAHWTAGAGPTMLADCETDLTNMCTPWWTMNDPFGSKITASTDEDGNLKITPTGGQNGGHMTVNFSTVAQGSGTSANYDAWGCGIGFSLSSETTKDKDVPVDLTGAISLSFYCKVPAAYATAAGVNPILVQLKVLGKPKDYPNFVAEIPKTKYTGSWVSVDIPFESFEIPSWHDDKGTKLSATDFKNIASVQFQFGGAATAQSSSFGIDEILINGIDLEGCSTQPCATKYTVTFNSNLGTPTPAAQEICAGDNATKPADPTRTDYSFDGWFATGASAAFNFATTPIAADITLTAQWTPVTCTQYTVTFVSDGTTVDAKTVCEGETVTAATAPSKTGYTFEGWFNGSTKVNFPMTVTANVTLTAQWTLIPSNSTLIANCENGAQTAFCSYWFTYDDNKPTNDGQGASTITPANGEDFTMTAGGANGTSYAAKIDYALNRNTMTYEPFVGFGFELNEDKSPFDLSAASGISFYHKGDAVNVQIVMKSLADSGKEYMYAVPASTNWQQINLTWADFTQPEWVILWDTPVPLNLTEITQIKWHKQGVAAAGAQPAGSIWIDEVQLEGNAYTLPKCATTCTEFTVTFENDGSVFATETTCEGETITAPAAPTKTGYTFDGWYNGSTKISFPMTVTVDVILVAQWIQDPCTTYTVTFVSDGTTVDAKTECVGEMITAPVAPTKVGYTFDGWYNGSTKVSFPMTVTANVTLVAQWIQDPCTTYTVTFVSDQITVDAKTECVGETITAAATPSKTGHTFDGWYNGATKVSFPMTVTANVTLVAQWTQDPCTTYTVTFVSDGTTVDAKTVCVGETIGAATAPSKAGYTFEGWFNGSTKVSFPYTVTGNATLTAQFTLASTSSLIANCEFEALTALCTYWFSYNDNKPTNDGQGASTITPADGEDFTMTAVEPNDINKTSYAAKIDYALDRNTMTYEPFVGFGFELNEDKSPFDLSSSSGISFYHKGDAVNVQIVMASLADSGKEYMYPVPASTNWQQINLTWADFTQPEWVILWDTPVPLNLMEITQIKWHKQGVAAAGSQPAGSIWIDEVQIEGLVMDLPCKEGGVGVVAVESATFAIYPNPAKAGNFNVSLAGSDSALLSIHNLQGQVVYSAAINNGAAINANLGAGVYVVSVQTANSVQTQKLIVK